MENINYKNLIDYHTGSVNSVKNSIISIVDFVKLLNLSNKTEFDSLWNLAEELNYGFDKIDLSYPGVTQEQKIFCMFPADDLKVFLLNFKSLLQELGFFEPVKKTEIAENNNIPQIIFDRLLNFDLPIEWLNNFSSLLVDNVEFNNFILRLDNLKEDYLILKKQLKAITAYMGYFSHIPIYTIQEVEKIFNVANEKYDLTKLASTVRENIWSDRGRSLSLLILDFFNNETVFNENEYSWEDAFIMSIFLHQVYNFFNKLTDIDQEFLLNYYFYKAIVVGAPVQNVLKKELYETTNVVDYVDVNLFFYKCIIANEEMIEIEFENRKKDKLGKILEDYLTLVKDNIHDGFRLENFLNNLYSKTNDKYRIQVLREIFYIFTHLKTVDLIDRNLGSIPSEDLIFKTELEALILWFFDKETWSLIVEYYNKKDAFVPMKFFLHELFINLEMAEEDVNNILDLSSLLKENHLLPEDQEIIFFNEQTGGFEFNNDLRV